MQIQELKQKVDSCRNALKNDVNKMVPFAESGPIGISIVDNIVAAIEAQELRIAELESRFEVTAPHGTFPSGLESPASSRQAAKLQQSKNTAGDKARANL